MEESQDPLLPLLLSLVLLVLMPRRSEKTSSRRVENGKELELWFNLSVKTEMLRFQSYHHHLHSLSRNSEIMKEIERKLRMSLIKETSLWNKLLRLPRPLKISLFQELSLEQSSKSSELVSLLDAQSTNSALKKFKRNSRAENLPSRNDDKIFKLSYQNQEVFEIVLTKKVWVYIIY